MSEDEEVLIIKEASKKGIEDAGKSTLSLLTVGVSDIFHFMNNSENEIEKEIKKIKYKKIADAYLFKSKNQENEIEKLKATISNPYGYMLVKDATNLSEHFVPDEILYQNIGKIVMMICDDVSGKDSFSNDEQVYNDYINLLSYAKTLSPYSMRILMGIPYESIHGDLGDGRGQDLDRFCTSFLNKYFKKQSKKNYNGFHLGIWELIDRGFLNLKQNDEMIDINYNFKSKYINQLISNKNRF